MISRIQWAVDLCHAAGWPASTPNLQALVAVCVGEGSRAQDNPADDELAEPGAGLYNPVGVRNYPSLAEGVQAVITTLSADAYGYPAVRNAFASGASAGDDVTAWALSEWGTWVSAAAALATLADVIATWPAAGLIDINDPSPSSPPQPTPEDIAMTGWTSPDGTTHVVAASSDTPAHLLHFACPSGGTWAVTDITDLLHNADPNAGVGSFAAGEGFYTIAG